MPSKTTSKPIVFFYTYVLLSFKDKKRYIGYTIDLKKRVEEHNRGLVFSTEDKRPLKLIYYEACTDERDAKQREKYLKTTAGPVRQLVSEILMT